MGTSQLLFAAISGIIILLILILRIRIHAFLALLISCIIVGLFAGLPPENLIQSIQNGMGSTLGFVATIVGLGSMFGAILEKTGSAERISVYLLDKFGEKNAPIAMLISGFIIAIPVFFDVGFIILIPMIYALQRKSGKSLLLYALPLLAGLAVTHAFIPPTPGPVAVADILQVNMGWVMLCGFISGIPAAIASGYFFSRWIASRISISAPESMVSENEIKQGIQNVHIVLAIVFCPIVLIVLQTLIEQAGIVMVPVIDKTIGIIGHPFGALIVANLLAWYFLGLRKKISAKDLLDVSGKSLMPAGSIILLTGAGGALKQILVDTGIGALLASSIQSAGFPVIAFAFASAALIRVLQGSATVAMITAAGLLAPIVGDLTLAPFQMACLVISIASGATIFAHVNDSGFWLVKQYLGMDEKQTFKTFSLLTTVIAITGFLFSVILFYML